MATTAQRLAALEAWKAAHLVNHVLTGHPTDPKAHGHPHPAETPHPADVLTAAEVSGLKTLLAAAGSGGGTTPVPNPPPVPPPTGPDVTAPVVSNVAITGVSTTGATVSWSLSEAGNGQVEFGTTTAYGQTTTLEASYLTAHSQTLAGLTPNLTYHVRIRSADAAGNLALSSDRTFTTAQTAPPPSTGYPPDRSLGTPVPLPSVPPLPAKYALYSDPFGTKGRRIGDSGQRHAYAKTQPWNADGSLLHFAYTGKLLDGNTYAVVSSALGNPGNYNWHPTDPDKGYSTQSGETNLYVHDVSNPASPSRSTLHDFGRAISLGNGEGSISDNGWVALIDGSGNVATWNVDTNSGSGFWSTGGVPDSVTMSRDGAYVVAVFEPASSGHPNEIWAYNRDGSGAHRVRTTARHGDTAVSAGGDQVWVQASGEMHKLALTDGPNTPLFPSGHAFSPVHVSGRGQAGWALFSVYDTVASAGKAGNDTLCMVKLDGSLTVRIYGFANRRGTSYETQPQAVPSRDGLRVLTATDWGNAGTYAIVLGVAP